MEQERYLNSLKFYLLAIKLKDKIRSGWDEKHWNISKERKESVAEHVYGTCILAISIDSEFNLGVDLNKVLKMLIIHELGEIIIGDITPHDNISPKMKKELEHQAIVEIVSSLIKKDELIDLMLEFDEHVSLESKFAYYCDKLEADIQSKLYQDSDLHRSLDNQENNVAMNNRVVQNIIKEGANTPFDIWYEMDKSIYEESEIFTNMLKLIKTKDLAKLN